MTPRIVTRLTIPIAAISALLLGLAIVAAWYIQDMQERASGPIASSVASMTAARELEISTREVAVQWNRYLITQDLDYLKKVPELKDHIEEALAKAKEASTAAEEDVLIKQILDGYDQFYKQYDTLINSPPPQALAAILSYTVIPDYDKNHYDPAFQGRYAEIIKMTDNILTTRILEPAHEYLRLNQQMLEQATETNQQLARWLTNGVLAVGLCGSAGGLLAGWVIAVTVRRSLRYTQERLRDAARQLDAAVPGSLAEPEPSSEDTLERVSVSVSAVVKRLRQTERDALRAEQLAWVGQMAAGIAHEIRNPLMAIKLLIQTAADRPDGPSLRPRDFQVLEEEIIRLEAIVSGFLDFARPPRPDPRPVDVVELASQVADGLRPRADLQGVSIRVVQPIEPVIASADPNQLRQVLLNLLFNSFDAQPRGGEVRIAARIDRAVSKDPQLVMTVSDDGPGLPASVGEKIFEPFVSTKESGLGLGLSICRRIVEAHSGTLTAATRSMGGATFTLRFPIRSSSVHQGERKLPEYSLKN
jgi:two-component system, NtrC family, sensor histidine kinase HydH